MYVKPVPESVITTKSRNLAFQRCLSTYEEENAMRGNDVCLISILYIVFVVIDRYFTF
jgi:hypothetical protein